MDFLHIYAQEFYHQDAYIVGSKKELIKLREALDQAIANDNDVVTMSSFVVDGEEYSINIVQLNEDIDTIMLPYSSVSYIPLNTGVHPAAICARQKTKKDLE